MPTACVDSALGNGVKGEFNSVGENSVKILVVRRERNPSTRRVLRTR